MKIPALKTQISAQRLKKSIWQPNAPNMSQSTSQDQNKTNVASKSNARVTRSSSSQENKTTTQNHKNCIKTRRQTKENNTENVIIDVLEEFRSYNQVGVANNSRKTKQTTCNISNKKTSRTPFVDISNIFQQTNSYQGLKTQKPLENAKDTEDIEQESSSLSSILSKEDDETEQCLSQRLQIQCQQIVNSLTQQHKPQKHPSSASTNASSASSLGVKAMRCSAKESHPQKMELEDKSHHKSSSRNSIFQHSAVNSQSSSHIHSQSSAEGHIQPLKHEYLEGYKVYQKSDKLFTFKIFKEDFLNIPAEFAKVIIHSQDDDVSSDDDVVRGGVKFNYKSILKEVYEEHELPSAPALNVHQIHFH